MRWLADENFEAPVVRGLLWRKPSLDIVLAQKAGLEGLPDPELLEWAARHGRIVLSRDYATMRAHAYQRIEGGQPTPPVFLMRRSATIGSLVEEILIIDECSQMDEWEGQVVYLPLR